MTFDDALAFTSRWEGGWSDNPADHGGATEYGITQATWDAWNRAIGAPPSSVSTCTRADARAIYGANYWRAAGCDRVPAPIALALFDAAVNSGPSQSIRWLQRAAGASIDGILGPHTLAAANSGDAHAIAGRMLDAREAFLRHLGEQPGQQQFLRGWLNRTTALRAACAAA